MNSVTEFNHGMARGLMLAIAMLQDDVHDFQKLTKIENGLPLTPLHAAAYNEILSAKQSLERAHHLFATQSTADYPINYVDAHWINEYESVGRGPRPCAV